MAEEYTPQVKCKNCYHLNKKSCWNIGMEIEKNEKIWCYGFEKKTNIKNISVGAG
jgi:hypothetical protein